MAKLRVDGVELWYARLDEGEQENRFEPTNPNWSIQIRSRVAKKAAWEAMGLSTHLEEDDKGTYIRANIRRKAVLLDGTTMTPPRVVDSRLKPLLGKTVGWGSIGNVGITSKESKDGVLRAMLDSVQVTAIRAPQLAAEIFEVLDQDTIVLEDDADEFTAIGDTSGKLEVADEDSKY